MISLYKSCSIRQAKYARKQSSIENPRGISIVESTSTQRSRQREDPKSMSYLQYVQLCTELSTTSSSILRLTSNNVQQGKPLFDKIVCVKLLFTLNNIQYLLSYFSSLPDLFFSYFFSFCLILVGFTTL